MDLIIPQLNTLNTKSTFEEIILQTNSLLQFNEIATLNWPDFAYKPKCSFQIAQVTDGIFLHFNVTEPKVLAEVMVDNGPVYNDSCVEFFMDPTGNGLYYNFEWNSRGVMLMGFGSSREGRELSTPENSLLVKRMVKSKETYAQGSQKMTNWELFILIPFRALFGHEIISLSGKNGKGNFYKCGNKTDIPHYVSWNKIKAPKPDFHRPEGFGSLYFE